MESIAVHPTRPATFKFVRTEADMNLSEEALDCVYERMRSLSNWDIAFQLVKHVADRLIPPLTWGGWGLETELSYMPVVCDFFLYRVADVPGGNFTPIDIDRLTKYVVKAAIAWKSHEPDNCIAMDLLEELAKDDTTVIGPCEGCDEIISSLTGGAVLKVGALNSQTPFTIRSAARRKRDFERVTKRLVDARETWDRITREASQAMQRDECFDPITATQFSQLSRIIAKLENMMENVSMRVNSRN